MNNIMYKLIIIGTVIFLSIFLSFLLSKKVEERGMLGYLNQ